MGNVSKFTHGVVYQKCPKNFGGSIGKTHTIRGGFSYQSGQSDNENISGIESLEGTGRRNINCIGFMEAYSNLGLLEITN